MRKFNNWNNRPYIKKTPYRPSNTKFDLRVDHSSEVLASFTFRQVKAEPYEDNDRLLKRFKRLIEGSGLFSELKKREYFKSEGQKKRERMQKSLKNAKKAQAKASRIDYDSKKFVPRNPRLPPRNP